MKFTTTLFALFFAFSLSAQYQRGNWYLDGQSGAAVGHVAVNGLTDVFTASIYSSQIGYFVNDRLLVGSQFSFTSLSSKDFPQVNNTRLQLNPFLRYYFPGGTERKVSFFGEAGFGTFTVFGAANEFFETDFHFGGGAELSLARGVLGTATLRYNANASGLNFTTLDFGLNVLTGQLENVGNAITLTRGTLTADANFGSISYGRMSRNGMTDQDSNVSLSPRIGYFLTNRLLVEANLTAALQTTREFVNFNGTGFQESLFSFNQFRVGLDLRYYLKENGKVFPYLTVGAGFNNNRVKNALEGAPFNEFTNKSSTSYWRAGAGFSYFLSPNLALDTEARFEKSNIPLNDVQLAFNGGFNNVRLEAGFKFFLPR